MPHDVIDNLRGRIASRKKDWSSFIEEQEKKAPKRKPVRTVVPEKMRGTLFAIRNKRLTIREGALRRVSIIITYKKITTGEIKKYEVNPVSYRYKKLRAGFRKVLYAYDKGEKKQLKNFVLRNIKNVALTDRKFRPDSRYPIEIK